MPRLYSALPLFCATLLLAACGAESSRPQECEPNTSTVCLCDAEQGLQVCSPDGEYGPCLCGDDAPDVSFDVPDPDTSAAPDTVTLDVTQNDSGCDEILLWPDEDGDGHGDLDTEPIRSCEYLLGYVDSSTDCDDDDRNVYPTALELCDELDNDCDTIVDEQAASVSQWIDADDDGYGDPESDTVEACALQAGYATNQDDCDDGDGDVNPAVSDLCDGIDSDCDGEVDEDAAYTVYYPDTDDDGYGDANALPQQFCAPVPGMVDNRDDCDDTTADISPDGIEICNLADDDCDGVMDEGTELLLLWPDVDVDTFGDGSVEPLYSCAPVDGMVTNGRDCDDEQFLIHPNATEMCDGVDNNCNGLVDDNATDLRAFYPDADGDGFGVSTGPVYACDAPANHSAIGGDCDDRFAAINPDITEVCDGLDNDCDRVVDEGTTNACGTCGPVPAEVCGNFQDDDCDGQIDEAGDGCFCDGRTNQPCYGGAPETRGVGLCRGGSVDCACPGGARFCDDGQWGSCEGQILPAEELCDDLDNDCDGRVDEGMRNACGACATDTPVEICDGEDNDCDGSVDEFVQLTCGACAAGERDEICGNAVDDNCDGFVDENCRCETNEDPCYPGPPDTRGVGACADGVRECYAGFEGVTRCLDAVVPSIEICDDIDNDCDGAVDESSDGCSICGTSAEICDGADNDCDGFVDEQLRNGCGDCLDTVVPEEGGGLGLCDGDDNDCDGFIDEGLMNACGNCDEFCYTDGWNDDADFDNGGDGDGIVADDGLRLNTTSFNFSDLWIANTADDTVTRINTDTGAVIGTYDVGIHSGRNNDNPSRTAVDLDGNAWVANRANVGGTRQGSFAKIRGGDCVTDCVEFILPIGPSGGGVPRALAVDADNNVWVGLHSERKVYRVNNEDGAILGSYDVPMTPYGFAIDNQGILWIASQSSSTGIGAFDTNTNTFLGEWSAPGCANTYGIAVDGEGNVWAGTWTCDSMLRLDREAFDATPRRIEFSIYDNGLDNNRGVAIDASGQIWLASSNSNRLARYNASGTLLSSTPTCSQPVGVGVANDGNIWIACYSSDQAQQFSPTGTLLQTIAVGDQPYSYSDMTGFQLRAFTAPAGEWVQTFDCGFAGCGIEAIRWTASVPPGTTLAVRARTREAGGTWSDWSADFTSSPANTSALPPGRFAEVRVRMTTSEHELTPVISRMDVDWQRP